MNTRFYLFISIFLILLACSGDPTLERGKAFLEAGDTTAAIQQFEAAIKAEPFQCRGLLSARFGALKG